MIRIKTQKKVLRNFRNIFKMNTFLTESPRAYLELNQISMVELFLQK